MFLAEVALVGELHAEQFPIFLGSANWFALNINSGINFSCSGKYVEAGILLHSNFNKKKPAPSVQMVQAYYKQFSHVNGHRRPTQVVV